MKEDVDIDGWGCIWGMWVLIAGIVWLCNEVIPTISGFL